MPRIARVVAVDVPHHVTQRGNNRQAVFLNDFDRRCYCKLLAEWSRRCGLRVLGYCLMTNHVHLVVVPERTDGLARGLGRAHFLYAREFHLHHSTSGHLWQNRFFSTALDARHLFAALRYVDLNPVRAGIVHPAEAYQWSSARAHVTGEDRSQLLDMAGWREICEPGDWRQLLSRPEEAAEAGRLRQATRTGRPCGDTAFVAEMEQRLGRRLRPDPGGRPVRGPAAVPGGDSHQVLPADGGLSPVEFDHKTW
jgi:REP-associated tyrosine transposase